MEAIVGEPLVQEKLSGLPRISVIYTDRECLVYESTHEGKKVAVKVKKYPSHYQRREASSHFRHPNVVELLHSFDFNYSDEEWIEVLVLELMDQDLRAEINRGRKINKQWSDEEVVSILLRTVDPLARAQQQNISHRDIKPSNILKVGNVYKIADFSFARRTTSDPSTIVGTPDYFSPLLRKAFQGRQTEVSHDIVRSDVYSLGLTILALNYPGQFKFSYFDMREKPFEIIKNLRYREEVKFMLRKMLAFEETERWDFLQLEEYLRANFQDFTPQVTDQIPFVVDSTTHSYSGDNIREVSTSISMGVDRV